MNIDYHIILYNNINKQKTNKCKRINNCLNSNLLKNTV